MTDHPNTWRDCTSGLTADQVTQLERIEAGGQSGKLLAVLAQQMAAVNDTAALADKLAHTVDTSERLAGLTEGDR